MPRYLSTLLPPCALVLLCVVASGQTSRPVDTLQFGLLDLGMSTTEVLTRLGLPAHVKTETRTVLVPIRDRVGQHRHKHDAPP